ncbi:MAG: tetratricopeptide repeat protein, partial [Desulfobacteraceae bacterium]|nr:tetratricopeptide repeat protein [Desulfobacteraceae bacterium]
GWVHFKRGSYDLAKTQFAQALKKLGDNPTVHYHLGMTLAKLGDKAGAAQELKQAIDLGGKDKFPELEAAKNLLAQLGKP